jgi:hypothetical protein
MKTTGRTLKQARDDSRWDEPQGPPLRPSDIEDIPGLPPYDPDMISYDPGGLEVVWFWVRRLFRRRPHDRAA